MCPVKGESHLYYQNELTFQMESTTPTLLSYTSPAIYIIYYLKILQFSVSTCKKLLYTATISETTVKPRTCSNLDRLVLNNSNAMKTIFCYVFAVSGNALARGTCDLGSHASKVYSLNLFHPSRLLGRFGFMHNSAYDFQYAGNFNLQAGHMANQSDMFKGHYIFI
jgi:hypothetical protein